MIKFEEAIKEVPRQIKRWFSSDNALDAVEKLNEKLELSGEDERIIPFLDSYNTFEGYHPNSREVNRERPRSIDLRKVVTAHLNLLDTLPSDVKDKLRGRL